MRCACVDIGSNTTRLLVADVDGDNWREVLSQRAYTKVGKGRDKDGSIAADRVEHVLEVVPTQVRMARQIGAEDLVVVATEAVRAAPNRDAILGPLHAALGIEVQLLSGSDEARLSFVGATKRMGPTLDGALAVIDVGGGSTEIAVGTQAEGATWDATFRVGSGKLAEAYLAGDPPSVHELENARSGGRRHPCAGSSAPSSRTTRSSAASGSSRPPRSRKWHAASISTRSASGSCRRGC